MSDGVFVHIREVMDTIRKGDAFDITWITADRKRKTGGKILQLRNAIRSDKPDNGVKKDVVAPEVAEVSNHTIPKRDPNHFKNDTINIRKRGTQRIMKVHPNLITMFNNKHVID